MKDFDPMKVIPQVVKVFETLDTLIAEAPESEQLIGHLVIELKKLPPPIFEYLLERDVDASRVTGELSPLIRATLGDDVYGRLSSVGALKHLDVAFNEVRKSGPFSKRGTKYTLTLTVYDEVDSDTVAAMRNILKSRLNCRHKLELIDQKEFWFDPKDTK